MATITQAITRIDRMFEPDPSALIWINAKSANGTIESPLFISNDGSGPLVWSIYHGSGLNGQYLPLLRSVKLDSSML
jgi:hypothetical protein